MTARLAQPGTAAHEHLNGDEHLPRELTANEQHAVNVRADEIIFERLQKAGEFHDLMAGIEPEGYEAYLQHALMNIANARSGDYLARDFVINAVWNICNVIRAEAETAWREEAEQMAEQEIAE